jgi:hypothetical protein
MTLLELLARGRAISRAWWFVPAVALVVVALLAHAWNEQRLAARAAVRLAEAAELRAKGFGAAIEVKEAQLRERIASEAGLKAEVERLKKASPGARPVAVVSGTTGPVAAGGTPRPSWPCSPAAPCRLTAPEKSEAPPGGASAEPPHDAAPGMNLAPTTPVCLLAEGDTGEVRGTAAAMRTRPGNLVVVGTAEAWRILPAPATRLFRGRLELDVSAVGPPRALGWGVGLYVGISRDGWAAGPALALPPVRWRGWQADVSVGAGVGPGGAWQGAGTAVLR